MNEAPDSFIEKNEDRSRVMRGVTERLESTDVMRDFAPLYNSKKDWIIIKINFITHNKESWFIEVFIFF